jgi:hypothetical protein
MEPQFTRTISSRFVCDYLYFYFWLVVVVSSLAVVASVGSAVAMKGPLLMKLFMVLPNLLVAALGGLLALSLYVICERGLRPEESSNKGGRSAEGFARGH